MAETEKHKRTIRSFVRRQGRMTPGQKRALDELWSLYGHESKDGIITLSAQGPIILEIGFGNGQSLATMAKQAPDSQFIGIEVHTPGIATLLMALEKQQITNVRVYREDALQVLRQAIPEQSLDRVQLFFPDPWPKKRHHKRRIVNEEFLQLIHSRLESKGVLHMATDWEEYAQYMLQQLQHTTGFINQGNSNGFAERPVYRPETKFERRGRRLGHGVWDLIWSKG